MVKIEYFFAHRSYRHLWLKYVRGANLSVHCARCLVGEYETRFKGYMASLANIELREAPAYYLCGVAHDRDWSHNLHVAFAYAAGREIVIDDEFCRMKIVNARRLEISPRFIDWSMPEARKREYWTCRNWQFANMLAKGRLDPYVHDAGNNNATQRNLFSDEETFVRGI